MTALHSRRHTLAPLRLSLQIGSADVGQRGAVDGAGGPCLSRSRSQHGACPRWPCQRTALLVPALLRLPRDGKPHPLAAYPPDAGRWDEGLAVVQATAGVLIAVTRFGQAETPDVLLLDADVALLMRERAGSSPSQRVPRAGTPQSSRLDAMLATLRGGQT